jgi:hypothetical protein
LRRSRPRTSSHGHKHTSSFMPELTPAQRAAGPHLATGVTLHKLYRKADAGPPCDICQLLIVKPLAAAGILVHPTCGGDFEDMLEALQRKVTAMTKERHVP